MAGPVFADGVIEETRTSGTTRPYVLRGTIAGGTRFRDAVPEGDWVYASVTHDGGPGFECIQARLTAPDELTVIQVLRSSFAGAPVAWPSSGRRFIRLQPAAAAHIGGLGDEMFFTALGLGGVSDLGVLDADITDTTDMGDLSTLGAGVLPDSDLRRIIDLGEIS